MCLSDCFSLLIDDFTPPSSSLSARRCSVVRARIVEESALQSCDSQRKLVASQRSSPCLWDRCVCQIHPAEVESTDSSVDFAGGIALTSTKSSVLRIRFKPSVVHKHASDLIPALARKNYDAISVWLCSPHFVHRHRRRLLAFNVLAKYEGQFSSAFYSTYFCGRDGLSRGLVRGDDKTRISFIFPRRAHVRCSGNRSSCRQAQCQLR
jgi:hypothetical protein